MKKALFLCVMLALHPVPAQGAKKLHAVVQVPSPGAFTYGTLNTGNDVTLGSPSCDLSGDVGAPAIATADSTIIWTCDTAFEPDYSVHAAAYSNVFGEPFCYLLKGTQYEIRWKTVSVQKLLPSGAVAFQDCTVWLADGSQHDIAGGIHNFPLTQHGAVITINEDTSGGGTCITEELPNGELHMVAGIR